jgi:hypothetical protein
MNKGIQILLERMKSNPEEFVPQYDGGTTKWNSVLSRYHSFLTKEEIEAFNTAQKKVVTEIMRERLTQEVMKELLDPNPYTVTGTTLGGLGGVTLSPYSNVATTATLNANSLTLGNQTLDQETIEHMKAHLDYIRKENIAKQKEQQTLVGKLYNYLGMNK